MSAIPGDIEPTQQPPMTLPLRHFLVAGGFLILGSLASLGLVAGLSPVLSLVHVHLLLAGWICVTIMGAMTQFVPVWSGTELYSDRLAAWQLRLVAVGLLGFVGILLTGQLTALPAAGVVMLAGFWTFVYNVGRTLATVETLDVTERHFAIALGFFLLVTLLGLLLAMDFAYPVLAGLPVTRTNVVASHATLAVFGAVLTTVVGALYQLATMFTQTELHGVNVHLRRVEESGYPVGVLLLATGRLLDDALVTTVGGVLVSLTLLGVCVVLARRLWESRVAWTPMLSRYAVAACALGLWAALTLPHWAIEPLDPTAVFGAPGTAHLLLLGAIGFVVFGTLYHIVPFIIWVHRYSPRLGYEPVPMVDDLYDHRIAVVDFVCLVAGTAILVAGDLGWLPGTGAAIGGVLVLLGASLFCGNLLLVILDHSPDSAVEILLGVDRTDPLEGADQPPQPTDGD